MRLIEEIRWQAILAGGPGSGVYLHQHRFNSPSRLNKLRLKEVSLRKLGLHKEAALFQEKIRQLENLRVASPPPGAEHLGVAEIRNTLQDQGFHPRGPNNTAYARGEGATRDFVDIDEKTGAWKYYFTGGDKDGNWGVDGVGADSLRQHLWQLSSGRTLMYETAKQHGFRRYGDSDSTYVRGTAPTQEFLGIEKTGAWKHYAPSGKSKLDDMYPTTGMGHASLREHLQKHRAMV